MLVKYKYLKGRILLLILAATIALIAIDGFSGGSSSWAQNADRFECLTTPNGIPCKVIVKKENAQAFSDSSFSKVVAPLAFFRKYFVFERDMTIGYLIGGATTRESILGWVRKEDVMPWNHSESLYFVNKDARADMTPVKVWLEERNVGDDQQPFFEERLNASHTTEPFPILSKEGSKVEIAFLWEPKGELKTIGKDQITGSDIDRNTGGKKPGLVTMKGKKEGNTEQSSIRKVMQDSIEDSIRQMEVMLVMDCTASMGPYMQEVRQQMGHILGTLRAMGKEKNLTVRVGVLGFRDYADEDDIVEYLDFTEDLTNVQKFVNGLSPFSKGKGRNEAVFEAVDVALRMAEWNTNSFKVMCLVGDAPPHRPGDVDTEWMKVRGDVASEYFDEPFESNVIRLQHKLRQMAVQFLIFGVGSDKEMLRDFPQMIEEGDMGKFLRMNNQTAFISQLRKELEERRKIHEQSSELVDQVISGEKKVLSERDVRYLGYHNLTEEMLTAMRDQRILTGWTDLEAVDDRAMVCVYLTRNELEDTIQSLRRMLTRDSVLAMLKKILGPYIDSQNSLDSIRSVSELLRLASDLPIPPEISSQIAGLAQQDVVDLVRKQIENILKLLYVDDVYNNYGEGWIPLYLLPGSMNLPR